MEMSAAAVWALPFQSVVYCFHSRTNGKKTFKNHCSISSQQSGLRGHEKRSLMQGSPGKPHQILTCDWGHGVLPRCRRRGCRPRCFQDAGFCQSQVSIDHFDWCWLPIIDQRWPMALAKVEQCFIQACFKLTSQSGFPLCDTSLH